jgi:hypothetical protein
MTSPVFWDSVAANAYDQSLFGYFNDAFASQLVRRHVGPSSSFLDVGAGTGNMSIKLAEKYPSTKVNTDVHVCIMKVDGMATRTSRSAPPHEASAIEGVHGY